MTFGFNDDLNNNMENSILGENVCQECGERPIRVKKWGLCKTCYSRVSAKDSRNMPTLKQSGEIDFVKNFFTHQNWVYLPAIFRIPTKEKIWKYAPDFYDGERNVFIEVSTTKQAYSQNKDKYTAFQRAYPHIKFEVRTSWGDLLDENKSINSQLTKEG